MSEDHQHEKVVTRTPMEDGGTRIKTESYYEKLAQSVEEIEKPVPTSKQAILKDLVDCLELITRDGVPEITIHIKAKHKEPILLTKRWTVSKESFNRR